MIRCHFRAALAQKDRSNPRIYLTDMVKNAENFKFQLAITLT